MDCYQGKGRGTHHQGIKNNHLFSPFTFILCLTFLSEFFASLSFSWMVTKEKPENQHHEITDNHIFPFFISNFHALSLSPISLMIHRRFPLTVSFPFLCLLTTSLLRGQRWGWLWGRLSDLHVSFADDVIGNWIFSLPELVWPRSYSWLMNERSFTATRS